uniref:Uncharacterized protein n=1 Tax=Rhizophora mucronata TaxID=61149 RepID=A0A2P2NL36_RHIMU
MDICSQVFQNILQDPKTPFVDIFSSESGQLETSMCIPVLLVILILKCRTETSQQHTQTH